MATIAGALAAKVLVLHALPTWEERPKRRRLFVNPAFYDWIDESKDLHEMYVGSRTLAEHIEQTLADFVCSERFTGGGLRRMQPTAKGVWTMRPPGMRLFGWCPAVHEFVVVTGATEAATKMNKTLNDVKRDEVLSFIAAEKLQNTIQLGDVSALYP